MAPRRAETPPGASSGGDSGGNASGGDAVAFADFSNDEAEGSGPRIVAALSSSAEDNTAALEDAFALANDGGTVSIPAGTYAFTDVVRDTFAPTADGSEWFHVNPATQSKVDPNSLRIGGVTHEVNYAESSAYPHLFPDLTIRGNTHEGQ